MTCVCGKPLRECEVATYGQCEDCYIARHSGSFSRFQNQTLGGAGKFQKDEHGRMLTITYNYTIRNREF